MRDWSPLLQRSHAGSAALVQLGQVRNELLALSNALDRGDMAAAARRLSALRSTCRTLAQQLESSSGAKPPRPEVLLAGPLRAVTDGEPLRDLPPAAISLKTSPSPEQTADQARPPVDPARVGSALELALRLHGSQYRKGTRIPYASHLMAVAALVMEDGGPEDLVIAALLHDAVEDQGGLPTLAAITESYGDAVAELVLACSDAAPNHGDSKPPWRERKTRYIAALETASEEALVIAAADKLHNAEATLADLRTDGEHVWDRFATGREGFLWYHDAVMAVLQRKLPDSRSVARLRRVLDELSAHAPPVFKNP